jgi:Tol biopolymer transport system component
MTAGVAVLASAGVVLAAAPAAAADCGTCGTTTRLSVGLTGEQSNFDSVRPAISGNGRFVAFQSGASNLVPGDTNGASEVFMRDRLAGVIHRVALGPDGRQANDDSSQAAITPNGRWVAFTSTASNLVAGDTNGKADVFVRDLVNGVTRRVSVGAGDEQGNGESFSPSISANGSTVAFASAASNLVPGDTDRGEDVFVRDLRAGVTRRVSANAISLAPAISANGRYVAFFSYASNLVPDDTNGVADVFVQDLFTGEVRRASIGQGGQQSNGVSGGPVVSGSGHYVAFISYASNLVPGDTNNAGDVFQRDMFSGATRRVSVGTLGRQANGTALSATMSVGGRYVAFDSDASNLVSDDTNGKIDVFVRDTVARTTRRVSVGPVGEQANDYSVEPAISSDGRSVAFDSDASNLVPDDTNGYIDVFVREKAWGPLTQLDRSPG